METLRKILEHAEANGVAIGHFNISALTLHGASGTDDDDLREAIAAGITVVHIDAEVRLAWRHGSDAALRKQPNEIVPYKLLPQVVGSVREIVAARLELFGTQRRFRSASN